MGILNVTPDSFADGGRHLDPGSAEAAGLAMEAQGADIIDVGGESTRPGSDPVSAEDELARVLPVIRRLVRATKVPISVDTSKAVVAEAALGEGATIVNDVSGLRYDAGLAQAAARARAGLVLMHARGSSKDMYREAHYRSVPQEVADELRISVERATSAGVSREALILDPGLGFAKKATQSFAALAGLPALVELGLPILVGASRKSFLTAAIGERAPDQRDVASAAAVAASVLLGAHIVRVHNVPGAVEAAHVADRLLAAAGF